MKIVDKTATTKCKNILPGEVFRTDKGEYFFKMSRVLLEGEPSGTQVNSLHLGTGEPYWCGDNVEVMPVLSYVVIGLNP